MIQAKTVGQQFHQSKDFAVTNVDEGKFCRIRVRMDGGFYIFPAVVFGDRVVTFQGFEGTPVQPWMQEEITKFMHKSTAEVAGVQEADFVRVEEEAKDGTETGTP